MIWKGWSGIDLFRFVDYRINVTDIGSLKTIAASVINNIDLAKIAGTLTVSTKLSNVVFNLIMLLVVLWACLLRKKDPKSKNKRLNGSIVFRTTKN